MKIPGDDDTLRQALEDVNLPNLLLVLATITGDDSWLGEEFAPAPIVAPEGSLFPDDSGGYSTSQRARILEAAVKIIGEVRAGHQDLGSTPNLERFHRMLQFSTGEVIDQEMAAMLLEETRFVDRDEQWLPALEKLNRERSGEALHVVIIGAGMSGLGTAAKLKRAGIGFTILEKNAAVGGTWYENRYPDCGVDTPNHFYSYSFHRNAKWSSYFSKRDELYTYFEQCADEFGVREHIRFNCTVTEMCFDPARLCWDVTFEDQTGGTQHLQASAVVSAVGQLNRPSRPDIEGLDDFQGAMWHSARWQDEDLSGKRVGVIGTGCSCVQLLPKTAAQAEHTVVFQRTPHWVAPARDYYKPVEPGLLWALQYIPYYAEFHRARMILVFGDRSWPAVVADPDWQDQSVSVNEANHAMRSVLIEFIKEGLGAKQSYVEHCIPKFPVWGKRLIVDNGWYETLAREDVTLVPYGIDRVTATGIVSADGEHHDLDVLILATGFESNRLLSPMRVLGLGGQELSEVWGDAANAYKGTTVPGFPNLFCLYGPNTNIVHGGSIIYQIECQIHYVMQCLTVLAAGEGRALDVRSEVNSAYNESVQSLSAGLAWGHPSVDSWYKNKAGQVVNNSPFSLQKFWAVTHDFDESDYRLLSHGANE